MVDLIQEPIGIALYEMKDGQISNVCIQGGLLTLRPPFVTACFAEVVPALCQGRRTVTTDRVMTVVTCHVQGRREKAVLMTLPAAMADPAARP